MNWERGVAVVSIDTELAWGDAHHRDGPGRDYSREREVIDAVLELLVRHRIPATWAVVGHLFLDRCTPIDGRPHPDLPRPAYSWLPGDWYDVDPGTSLEQAPDYYGTDIVTAIRTGPVPQEIGCHSFSHLIADDPGCPPHVFAAELHACRAVAQRHGVELRSYVYPRNAIDHVDQLPAHGFTGYRGRPQPWATTSLADRMARLTDRVRAHPRSAVHPTRHPTGIWNIPQTYLFAPATHRRHLPVGIWARRPLARLHLAARQRSLFHLWFHPYNITANPLRALHALDLVLTETARLRHEGRVDTLTMGELTDRLDATDRTNSR